MNKNHQAVYPSELVHPVCTVDTAEVLLDGSGSNYVTLYTAPAGGAVLISLSAQATDDTTAGMICVYIDKGSGPELYKTITVTANTVAAGTPPWRETMTPDSGEGVYLESGDIVKVSTYISETFKIHAEIGEW